MAAAAASGRRRREARFAPLSAAALVVVAALLAGCGESKTSAPAPDKEARKGETAETPTEAAPAARAAPLTVAQWRTHYMAWLEEMTEAATGVGLIVGDPEALETFRRDGEEVLSESFETNLANLLDCSGSAEALAPPPRRLRRVTRLLGSACRRFERGAELIDQGLATGDDRRSFRAASGQWRLGANLVERANGLLPRPERTEMLPLPVQAGRVRFSRIEPILTHAVYRVVPGLDGYGVDVRCWSAGDWPRIEREEFGKYANLAGFASSDRASVNLAPKICADLALVTYTKERPTGVRQLDVAFAFVVFMHEVSHVWDGGFSEFGGSEPSAECWGMQHVRSAARALGVEAGYAKELAERYWDEVYPLVHKRYRSTQCREGGKLDARPTSRVWP